MGSVLGLSWTQRLLIACGFSICGAAATAAVDGVVDAKERKSSPRWRSWCSSAP